MDSSGQWGYPAVSNMTGSYQYESGWSPLAVSTISYPGGQVEFEYSSNTDPSASGNVRRSYPKTLSSMKVKATSPAVSSTATVLTCSFSVPFQSSDRRNLLRSVTLTGRDGALVESYRFTYLSEGTYMNPAAKDLFGYYNAASNGGVTAFLRLFDDNYTFTETVADRSYKASAVSALSLETISTASGSMTEFVYEGNGISTGGASGLFSTIGVGHRIRRILTYDLSGGGQTLVRQRDFSYASPGITIPLVAFNRRSFITVTEVFRDDLQRPSTVNGGSGIESASYGYTLQGWLSSMSSTSWEETLRYASPSRTATSALPGKAGLVTEWTRQQKGTSSGGTATAETFAYSYDKAGRLTGGVRYPGTSTTSDGVYTEQGIAYDRSGNLTALTRRDATGAVSQTLSYSYSGPKRTTWSYDNHGNVTADPQGGMSFQWNALDLPRTLASGGTSTLRGYLADGTLAEVSDGTATRIYLGDMVFTVSGTDGTPVLESAGWDGGRLLPGSGADKVLYYVTDHLGSVRAVRDGAGTVRQRFDYYPFGSVSRVYTSDAAEDGSLKRYRFGGKEIAGAAMTELGGTGSAPAAPYLDFGARLYYPGSVTWLSSDPLAEKYYGISPHVYCAGNPVNRFDPEGLTDYFSNFGDFLFRDYDDINLIRITHQDLIDAALSLPKEDRTSFLNENSISFHYAVSSQSITHDSALRIYNHYNKTGLPLVVDNDISGNFEINNLGENGQIRIVVNIKRNSTPNDIGFTFDNYVDISNAINAHEGRGHYAKYKEIGPFAYDKIPKYMRELDAIKVQMSDPSWVFTSSGYQKGVLNYQTRMKNKVK